VVATEKGRSVRLPGGGLGAMARHALMPRDEQRDRLAYDLSGRVPENPLRSPVERRICSSLC
jgi:hypothetical protein